MKYGFIGCGNMGGAIARVLSAHTTDFVLTDRSGRGRALAEELGGAYCSNREAAESCDRLFLAVKPQMMQGVLEEIRDILQEKKPVLISMAAGLTLTQLEQMAGGSLPVIRIMPNTPCQVGRGIVFYCANGRTDPAVIQDVVWDLREAGHLEPAEEKQFDALGTLAGCGPAYVYMFLEALADGAVACGIPRKQAMECAALMVEGAAAMAEKDGGNPGSLKDAVCSPGGSTIMGVKALEDRGFRGAVMECILAACEKSRTLGKV